MGPNIEPLKKKYEQIYACLGEDVKNDLFIEKTDFGNYALVYRRRGDKASTTQVARKHAKILRSKKISTSITMENNNMVMYGESSLIDDVDPEEPKTCAIPGIATITPIPEISIPEKIVATSKIIKKIRMYES